MATYTVTVGASARPVLIDSLTFAETVSGADSLSCTVRSLAGTYRPAVNDVINVAEGVTTIFEGLVDSSFELGANNAGNLPGILLRVTAKSYSLYPARRVVSHTFAAGTLKSQLTDFVTTYLATFGVALHASQANGPTMQAFTFTRRKGHEALDDLMAAASFLANASWVWKIDENKKLRAYAAGDIAAPFNVIDGDGHAILDVRVETNRNLNYANRLFGVVTGAGPATSTETFVAADGVSGGGFIRFTTKYPASQSINDMWPNELLINGVPLGPIEFGTALPFAWSWDYVNHQLVYDTSFVGYAFPVGADVLEVTYAIGYPYEVVKEDAGGIATYNLFEDTVERAEALTAAAMDDLLAGLLSQTSPIDRTVYYDTLETGIRPGMTQTVTAAKRNFNGSVMATEVTTKWATDTVAIRSVKAEESLTNQGSYRGVYEQMLSDTVGGSGGVSTGGAGLGPGGVDTNVQFNQQGGFGGNASFTYDYTHPAVNLTGALAPTGSGGQRAVLLLDSIIAPTANTTGKYGIYSYIEKPSGNTFNISNALEGIYCEAKVRGTGTVQNIVGGDFEAHCDSAATISVGMTGVYAEATHTGSGSLNNTITGLEAFAASAGTGAVNDSVIGVDVGAQSTNTTANLTSVEGVNIEATGNSNTLGVYGILYSSRGAKQDVFGISGGSVATANLTGVLIGASIGVDASSHTVTGGIFGLNIAATTSGPSDVFGINVIASETGGGSPVPDVYGVKVNVTGSGTIYGLHVTGDAALQNQLDGTNVLSGLTYPTVDGNAGEVLSTDGSGTLSFVADSVAIKRAILTIGNAAIITLPGTPVTLIPAPSSGFRNKILSATLIMDNNAGVYTGLSATYATLIIQNVGASWISVPLVNDNSITPNLTNVTTFFNTAHNPATSGAGGVWDVALPSFFGAVGAPGAPPPYLSGWVENLMTTSRVDIDGIATQLALDNNSSATNLGGGNAANTLKVVITYMIEPVLP